MGSLDGFKTVDELSDDEDENERKLRKATGKQKGQKFDALGTDGFHKIKKLLIKLGMYESDESEVEEDPNENCDSRYVSESRLKGFLLFILMCECVHI